MRLRSKVIYTVLALVIAILAQRLWMSELNFFVWKITYIGAQAAFLVAPPNYDSAASVGIFQTVAVIINACVYFAVLWALHTLLARLRRKRGVERAAVS